MGNAKGVMPKHIIVIIRAAFRDHLASDQRRRQERAVRPGMQTNQAGCLLPCANKLLARFDEFMWRIEQERLK